MLSPHFDPQGHYGEAIVGLSVGADACSSCAGAKGHCGATTGHGEGEGLHPPRRSMYIFRGRALMSLQPGYTHGPSGRRACRAAGWNPRRRRSMAAGKALESFCLEEPPSRSLRASPAERAQRPGAPAAKDRKAKRKGEGAGGSGQRDCGLGRAALEGWPGASSGRPECCRCRDPVAGGKSTRDARRYWHGRGGGAGASRPPRPGHRRWRLINRRHGRRQRRGARRAATSAATSADPQARHHEDGVSHGRGADLRGLGLGFS